MSAPIDNGGPAFARSATKGTSGIITRDAQTGMSLRDYFAGQALVGLCGRDLQGAGESNRNLSNHINHACVRDARNSVSFNARLAYETADAMLVSRERKGGAA